MNSEEDTAFVKLRLGGSHVVADKGRASAAASRETRKWAESGRRPMRVPGVMEKRRLLMMGVDMGLESLELPPARDCKGKGRGGGPMGGNP